MLKTKSFFYYSKKDEIVKKQLYLQFYLFNSTYLVNLFDIPWKIFIPIKVNN